MKKTSLQSLVNYLNGETVTNIAEIKAEIEAELAKGEAKAQANRDLYAEATPIVLGALSVNSMTRSPTNCPKDLPRVRFSIS